MPTVLITGASQGIGAAIAEVFAAHYGRKARLALVARSGDRLAAVAEKVPAVSAVSIVEVLGYHQLAEEDRRYFEEFFAVAEVFPITPARRPEFEAWVAARQGDQP